MKRVLLGFSGGIDSIASAHILTREGYDVTLVTLDTTDDHLVLEKAAQTAREMDLPWRKIDVRDRFRIEIIDYFRDSYLKGETPVPCTLCNPLIKWRTLYETARRDGFDHIATGHYFRITQSDGHFLVRKAADPDKDQSYFLWALPQEYLQMALTPLGDRLKREVKKEFGFRADTPESMGVCFLRGENYADYLRRIFPGIGPGEIVDPAGQPIGTHKGFPLYTIGQKRGLNTPYPCAVIAIDPDNNRLVAGDDNRLHHLNLLLRDPHVPNPARLFSSEHLQVKIRGIGRNPSGYVRAETEGKFLRIRLSDPAWAAAKGQSVVLYEGDLVLGGGFLENYW